MDHVLDEPHPLVSFEAADYPLVIWLDMGCEIWLKIYDSDVLKVPRNNVAREVVLKQENFVPLCLKF